MTSTQNENAIRSFLDDLAALDWVRRSERRWWPKFVFHYTDIRNAVSILEEGKLYSRHQVTRLGKLAISSGSASILASTDKDIRDYVRLYFRPKTPTQFHAEGIHSRQSLAQSRFPDAHCPIPVFFLFDAASILSREDALFSDRGLGGHNYRLYSGLEDLKNLPWKQIYHQGWIDQNDPANAREIIAHRNAEVIVRRSLDLSTLRFIYCRSDAEKDTLLHLLNPTLRGKYQGKILASNRSGLFFRHRTFIESATLMGNMVHLRFSPDTKCPGPFHLRITITTTKDFIHDDSHFVLGPSYDFEIQLRYPLSNYTVTVTLDRHPVYASAFKEILPF